MHVQKIPLLDNNNSSKVKAYKRKLEEDEELSAKILKRKRVTEALAKQGVRARYENGFGQSISEQHCTFTTDKRLKSRCKRKKLK